LNARSLLIGLGSGLVSLALGACATVPPPSVDAPPAYDPAPAYPHWLGKPVSWSKLGDIEAWLAGAGARQHPEFVPNAELELAEGRLALAEKESEGLAQGVLALRLKTAERGFSGLLAREGLAPVIRTRAERGLAHIAKLQGSTRTPASAPLAKESAGLVIQPRSAWKAAAAQPNRLTPNTGPWNRITIHHSAKDSKEMGTPTSGNVAEHIHDIQNFHVRGRAWGDIGYHFLIDPTGRIWQGRLLDWQGAHAQGANNVANIGICLIGDFNHERPDPRALESLERLVDALCERHEITRERVYGHRRFAATECPGDSLMAWVARYASGATH
jgi:hypothetical protein